MNISLATMAEWARKLFRRRAEKPKEILSLTDAWVEFCEMEMDRRRRNAESAKAAR